MLVQSEEAESLKVKAQSRQREYERVMSELSLARSREQGHWAKAKEVGTPLHYAVEAMVVLLRRHMWMVDCSSCEHM